MQHQFLALQGSYTTVEVALFSGSILRDRATLLNKRASAFLIPTLDTILKHNSCALKDLTFIAVDHGPGAFTSLRVTLTTLNAIGFAASVPLVGVDGLDALAHHALKKLPAEGVRHLAVLLNAYNNDVFYALYDLAPDGAATPTDLRGVAKIDVVLGDIAQRCSSETVAFVGNGVPMHQEKLSALEGITVTTPKIDADVAPVEVIAELGLAAWEKNPRAILSLKPQYLKTQVFATQNQTPRN